MNAPVKTATLQTIKNPPPAEAGMPAVHVGFGSLQSFELTQRIAKLFASSTLVPVQYRAWVESKSQKGQFEENPAALSNCCIAINMAERLHADPLMVMQNLHIIEGRPGWSSVWIIASINQCGRFEPLRFDMSAQGEPQDISYEYTEWEGPQGNRRRVTKTKTVKVRDRTCIAWTVPKGTIFPAGVNTLAKARAAGLTVYESTPVSMDLAIKEGWYQRNGSKWQTMADQMLVYRSASFFGRVYAPELLLGLPSEDEIHDILTARRNDAGTFEVLDIGDLRPPAAGAVTTDEDDDPGAGSDAGNSAADSQGAPPPADAHVDHGTGEIKQGQQQAEGAPTLEDAISLIKKGDEESLTLAREIGREIGKLDVVDGMIANRKQPAEQEQQQETRPRGRRG